MSRNKVGVPYENPTRYVGPGTDIIPIVKVSREPTVSDVRFPLGQFWIVGPSPATGTEGEMWYLSEYTSGVPQWVKLTTGGGGAGTMTGLRDQVDASVTPSIGGTIDVDGSAVANGTNPSGIPLETVAGVETITAQIQVAADVTGAPGDTNDAGIASFDDTAFSVDADGYVTLVGGGVTPPTMSYDVDSATPAGTDPTVPTALGVVTISGAAVAAHTTPVETHARAANAFNVEVQVADAITGAPGDTNDAGLCSFDDTAFTVDADGYVELIGGGVAPPTMSVDVDSNSAPGTDPVVADGTGQITVAGAAVAAHSVPIETHSRAANAYNVEVQVASDRTGAPGNTNDAGIASFNDTDFSVDADGYVSALGAGGSIKAAGTFLHRWTPGAATIVQDINLSTVTATLTVSTEQVYTIALDGGATSGSYAIIVADYQYGTPGSTYCRGYSFSGTTFSLVATGNVTAGTPISFIVMQP